MSVTYSPLTSKNAPPTVLPAIDTAADPVAGAPKGARGGNSPLTTPSSASLRGSRHTKVPDIDRRPMNAMLPSQEHPEPYYITQSTKLNLSSARTPPWLEAQRAEEMRLLDFWNSSPKFQANFIEEFIKDSVYLDVQGICSGQSAALRTNDRNEAQALIYLENHVITDEVYASVEEIVWEALWDEARKLKQRDIEELDSLYRKHEVDKHTMHVLRQNYTRPIRPEAGGDTLMQNTWAELLYTLHRLMQRGSLMENYAIKTLQEQIICQVAAKVVLDEALKFMEDEMAMMDEDERVDNPPRRG